jgi:hypothetical protein
LARQHPRWADDPPDPETYRAQPGRSRNAAVAEQDLAAGGLSRRVRLPDGTQRTASVELKFLGGRRVYAYLRYQNQGRTVTTYLGEAPGRDRVERLRVAWRIARARGLLDEDP